MLVTLPFVLLLLDVWPLKRVRFTRADATVWRRVALEKLPLLALALCTSIATVIVQQRVGAMASFDVLPWRLRAANATVALRGVCLEDDLADGSRGLLSVPRLRDVAGTVCCALDCGHVGPRHPGAS